MRYAPRDNEILTKSVKLKTNNDGSTYFQLHIGDVERLQKLIKEAKGPQGVRLSFNTVQREKNNFLSSQMYVDQISMPTKRKRFVIFKPKSKAMLDKLRHKLLKWCMKGVNVTSKIKNVPIYILLGFFLTGCGQGTLTEGVDLTQLEQDVQALQDQNAALQALIEAQEPGVDLHLVDPCPAVDAVFREVLVCINDEILLALYYTDDEAFFAEIPPGNYVTTDTRQCQFIVGEKCSTDQL